MKPYLLIALLLLTACNGVTQNNKNTQTVQKSKAKNKPEVQQMLMAFNKQQHRLEFNGCEMLYNGKPFKLGMTIKELTDVFGEYDIFDDGFYIWVNIGMVFVSKERKENSTSKGEYIYIYMNTNIKKDTKDGYTYRLHPKQDYFLVQGMPIHKDMQFKDLINNSNFKLDDFSIDNYGYKLRRDCKGKMLESRYSFKVKGGWIYKGAGHLMTKSHTNKNNTNKIEYFNIE